MSNRILILLPAVSMLLFSCAKLQDSAGTEPENLTFSVSLVGSDQTKTYLGGKQGNVYPTLWHEGDRISLNGTPSGALGADQEGVAKASFVFRGGLFSPFNLLYPATESLREVSFPEVQNYTEGSFDPACAPMWASTAAYEDVTLKHLSSLLRFRISGDATLAKISIVALGREPISGTFAMQVDGDGAFTGVIEPVEASNKLALSFGEGLELGADATEIYVAVPYGKYSEGFSATVTAVDGSTMMLSFFTKEAREIAPSKVLEFPEVTFTPDADDVLHIYDEEDFKLLSTTTASKVYIHEDIDMTGVSWTGKVNFNGVIDGLYHSVKGLGVAMLGQKAGSKLLLQNLCIRESSVTSFTAAGGDITLRNVTFINNTSTGNPAVNVSGTAGHFKFICCDFIGNYTTAKSGNNAAFTSSATTIPIYFTHCRFINNVGAAYGSAIHQTGNTNAASVVAVDNCLFWGNSNNAASDPVPVNIGSGSMIVLNTTIMQSVPGYSYAVRCGAHTDMDHSFVANSIVSNVNAGKYSFYAAANTYFIKSAGYNQYCPAATKTTANPPVDLSQSYSWTKTGGVPGVMDNYVGVPEYYTVPSEANGYLYSWEMPQDRTLPGIGDIKKLTDWSMAKDFFAWLESVEIGGHNALEVDLYGNVRDASAIWPGCYQKEEGRQ